MKFNLLDSSNNPLSLHFYNVQSKGLTQFRVLIAYQEINSLQILMKEYSGIALRIEKLGSTAIEPLLNMINLPGKEAEEIPAVAMMDASTPVVVDPPDTTDKFVHGLMLATDKFIKAKKDKEAVRKILAKIKK